MDITMAIVIATVFCALIVSLFMVAYRYNAMSSEMKNIGLLLKKQIKAEASFHSLFMEQMGHGAKPLEGEGAAAPPAGGLSSNPVLLKLDALAGCVDELAALLNEQLDQASADASATIPPKKARPPVQPKPTDEEPEEPDEEPESEAADQPEPEEPEKVTKEIQEEAHFDDKTAVRCPSCSRQLPYDALRIQDEQVCPYCQEVFRSNSYLLALITERSGKGKRPVARPPETA